MTTLQTEVFKKLMRAAETHLRGDWVLMGGALLPVLGYEYRTTADIDLVPVGGDPNRNLGQTMELAEHLGLPYEAVNSAGSYFLTKVPDFEKHLVLLSSGEHCRILRPNVFLYVTLKMHRLTESDCEDCIQFIRFAGGCADKELFDVTKAVVNERLAACKNAKKKARIRKILEAFPID